MPVVCMDVNEDIKNEACRKDGIVNCYYGLKCDFLSMFLNIFMAVKGKDNSTIK